MKKILLKTLLSIAGIASINAQALLNGNFSQYSAPNNNLVTYTSWSGNAYTDNSINGGTDNNALLKATLSPVFSTRVCIAYSKANGSCIEYSIPSIIGYSLNQNTINQSVSITSIPEKIKGSFKFSSNATGMNAAMVIEGNFLDQRFQDTLIVDANTQGTVLELPIGKNYLPCTITIVTPKGNLLSNNCPVKNTINIQLLSCLTCPNTTTPNNTTSLAVDDLSIVYTTVTDITDNQMNTNNIYPNPATDFISVPEFSEVFDLLGNKLTQGIGKIDVSSLNNGVYVVKTANAITKVVKE